jgi:hypothetical protein
MTICCCSLLAWHDRPKEAQGSCFLGLQIFSLDKTFGKTPQMGDQPVARSVSTQENHKHRRMQTYIMNAIGGIRKRTPVFKQ